MDPVRFEHLLGEDAWLRCDHAGTTLLSGSAGVRLATAEEAGGADDRIDGDTFAAWLAARGGAQRCRCPPDHCDRERVLLADPSGSLFAGDDKGWRLLALGSAPTAASGPLRFSPLDPAPAAFELHVPGALACDPAGRLWLLERGADRVRLLAQDDLRLIATVRAPTCTRHLATGTVHAWAITATALFRQAYGGEWVEVGLDLADGAELVAVACGPDDRAVVLARLAVAEAAPDGTEVWAHLHLVDAGAVRTHALPGVEDPLPMLVLPDGELLVGELSGAPGSRTRFHRFVIDDLGVHPVGAADARGFDGRGLVVSDDGLVTFSTAKGMRRLIAARERYLAEGRIESHALDSHRPGAVWHRVFVDACIPPGTSVSLQARTSDDLWSTPRAPSPPSGGYTSVDDRDRPLGSRHADDDEGWFELAALDKRPGQIDQPFPPERAALPSDDPWERGDLVRSFDSIETLEGLLPTDGGRYLWVRLVLRGTRRRTPTIHGFRATWPRPSLLDHLPAYWRADPAVASQLDRVLALFEGPLTELDARIAALPLLFDPERTPPEALSWLAGFIGLSFDQRLEEGVRRQLLAERVALYRQRGTSAGLRRLCEILTGGRVAVVEGWALRGSVGALLGVQADREDLPPAVLGPGMQLGGTEDDPRGLGSEDWEDALLDAHVERSEQYETQLAEWEAGTRDRPPCPADPPTMPIDLDPLLSFYRRFAHRFSVILFSPCFEDLREIVESAVKASKPAHTLHELCWLDAGFRVGSSTYVGLGTSLSDSAAFQPAILDEVVLGGRILSTPHPARLLGTFVGGARIGSTTNLG